jgi:urea transport system permease protein
VERAAFAEPARALHTTRGIGVLVGLFVLAAVVVPLLGTLTGPSSALHVPGYLFPLLGKFACYALVAIAVDMIWGFAGILSLGHGVFFALGGYAMGMYLMRQIGAEGVYASDLPDFMVFLDWKELPWYWYGFEHFPFAVVMALLVPGVLAYVFGYLAFRSRVRGVYFSIITQALTFAMVLLFFRNNTGFGGNNGLTDFKRMFGYSLQEPSTKIGLYIASVVALFAGYLLCKWVIHSKLGKSVRAIRDHESRLMFSGYNVPQFKLFVWTLSAVICGLAGALYVPQVGIINPSEMDPANSIEIVIWVAVGGRGTLVGAAAGAILVNLMKSWLTAAVPDLWPLILGAMFVLVPLCMPGGATAAFSRAFAPIAAMMRPAPAEPVRAAA